MYESDEHSWWGCFIYGFLSVILALLVAKMIYILWYGGHL